MNNNKQWFEEHREEYLREFQYPMRELCDGVHERIKDACGDRDFARKVSRIYKDARRLRGGDPYRDHLWFTFESPNGERASAIVFWFELTPDEWSYGLGYYRAKPVTMEKLRARIDRSPEAFEKLIAPLAKREKFVLEGPEYARKRIAPTEKTAAWYNKKSFSVTFCGQHDAVLFSPELANRVAGEFIFLMPFYDYFASLDVDLAQGSR